MDSDFKRCMAGLLWQNGGQGLGESVDGYLTALVGRTLNPEREVSGLGLDGLQEVVFQWWAHGWSGSCWRQGGGGT